MEPRDYLQRLKEDADFFHGRPVFAGRSKQLSMDEDCDEFSQLRKLNAELLAALKSFRSFVASSGCAPGRPAWFTDDDAWMDLVSADEQARAAISKAEAK